jgi:hypothetical protein
MPEISTGSSRRRRSWARGDIAPITRPDVTVAKWSDQTGAVEQMSSWAETRTVETINWYLRDKRVKRWASRFLRAASIAFAVTGGVLPLISSSTGSINPNLGYIFLAVAAGCVAFDHFFGLSSGWMRDITAIQVLQNRLTRYHLEWARWQSTHAGALSGTGSEAADEATAIGLDLIGDLVVDLAQLTESETAQWVAEFSNSMAALRKEATPSVVSPEELFTWTRPRDPTG